MKNPKEQLPTYLENLCNQIFRVASKLDTYSYIRECENNERFEILNATPSFWLTIIDALETDIIVSLRNLFDPRSPMYLCTALAQIETHHISAHLLTRDSKIKASLKVFFNKNQQVIDSSNEKITALVHHRNNYRAHISKKYFDDPSQLAEVNPLLLSDLKELLEVAQNIIKEYGANFLDKDVILETPSHDNIKRLFSALLNYRHLITESAKDPIIFDWFQEHQRKHFD
jgi:AbiU2